MKKIKRILKSNRNIYRIYNKIFSRIISFIGIFIKSRNDRVLFVVYGGTRYDDSPMVIYEKLLSKNANYQMKWAFVNPSNIECPVPFKNRIKIDTPRYFYEALRSGVWITNSSVTRGLNFKNKNTKYYFFTHGTVGCCKKMGNDIEEQSIEYGENHIEKYDKIFLQGYDKEINCLERAWDYDRDVYQIVGYPRNDELVDTMENLNKKKNDIREELDIPKDKKVILYAPTFREYSKDEEKAVFLNPPINFERWEEQLGNEYVLLIAAHYAVEKFLGVPEKNKFVKNVTGKYQINKLLIVSDLLITDYSSVLVDYSLLGKPILSYDFDFEEYSENRGVYPEYNELFYNGIIKNEEVLLNIIKNLDFNEASQFSIKNVRDKYISVYGKTAEKIISKLF